MVWAFFTISSLIIHLQEFFKPVILWVLQVEISLKIEVQKFWVMTQRCCCGIIWWSRCCCYLFLLVQVIQLDFIQETLHYVWKFIRTRVWEAVYVLQSPLGLGFFSVRLCYQVNLVMFSHNYHMVRFNVLRFRLVPITIWSLVQLSLLSSIQRLVQDIYFGSYANIWGSTWSILGIFSKKEVICASLDS